MVAILHARCTSGGFLVGDPPVASTKQMVFRQIVGFTSATDG